MRELLPPSSVQRLSGRDKAYDEVDLAAREKFLARDDALILTLSAGIERENYTSAWVNDKIRKYRAGVDDPEFKDDPDYRFEDDDLNFGYDPSIMVDARSAEEAAAFRAQIDKEKANLQMISKSAWGSVGQAFGGIFQPHVAAALPVAAVSVTGMVALETALEAGSEVLLHQQQKTRTLEDSYWNVGLTAAGAALMGGGAKFLGNMRKPPTDVIDEINAGVPVGSGDGNLSAAAVVLEESITAEDDRLIGGSLADAFSIGQMAALSKSVSQAARDIAGKLADNPLFNRGHAKGKTRGVSVESLHEAAMGRVVVSTNKAAEMQKTSGLSVDEFEHEVGIAMSNGDRHVNPKVQEAAEMYRAEVIGPIQEAASRLGLLETEEGLRYKISQVETDVQRLIDEGSGPGSTARTRELEAKKAEVITAAKRTTDALKARLEVTEAQLDMARTPGADGKPRKAPASMVKANNDAKKALSKHQKKIEKRNAAYSKELSEIKARNKRLAKARKKLRKLQTRLANGADLHAESYFPRVYDKNKIMDNWEALQDMLETHFAADPKIAAKMEPGEITEMAIDTIQNMIGAKTQTVDGAGKPSALRARALSLLDNDLETFLEKRASAIMIRHAQGLQPYIMMREAFEGRTMAEMIDLVKDDYTNLLAGTTNLAERNKLLKKQKDDIDRLMVMHDRLMHQVQRAIKPNSTVEKVMQFSKLWNLATMLGGVVLSSLPDIARPIAHYGLRSFSKGVAKGVAQAFSGANSLPSIQVKRTGAALQRTLNDRAMQLSDSLEPDTKWMQRGQKIWSKVTGFDRYTDIMESVATHAAMDYVVRQAAKVASEQPLSKSAKKQLARMGLNDDDLLGIYNESMNSMGAQDSVLKYMNTMDWADNDLAKRVEGALGSDVRRTIIRLGVGDKPAFMDETFYSWLLQFQSFAMGAQNKIMVAGLQNMNRHTAEGLAAMLFLGASVGAAKSTLRGQDVSDWSLEQWAFEGIDRSGMIGALREPMNMLRYMGASYGITDGVPSRYAGQGWERAVTAPAASVIGQGARAVHAAIDGDPAKAAHHVLKATPYANTWHIREVLIQLGDLK